MENKKITLSVALAVMNEEKNISSCLLSIKDIADEIILVDGGSIDNTVEIAKSFGVKLIETDNPPIFHINKQKALDACHGIWILQLDADEMVTKELAGEILQVISKPTSNENGYYIPRKNNFWGHFMKKGGQYPDYVIRLVKRGKARFPCLSVHEQIEVDGALGYLKNPLLHYSYPTLSDYWKKAGTYTTLSAQDLKKKNVHPSLGLWLSYYVSRPVRTFFSLFIRHKGFYDGIYGFLFSIFSALHYPITYHKFIKLNTHSS